MIETIVAQATPPGRGGIGILRISGPHVISIACALLGSCPKPRHAHCRPFYDQKGQILDQGIALFFPQPHSFTGEDVLELQAHGGPIVLDLLMQAILQHPGVRIARPGEFSERAFLNNKLDLTQAEAIADLIDASSEKAARCAMSSLQGAFSQRIEKLVRDLVQLRLFVESALDFPEEEIDFLSETRVAADLDQLIIDVNAVYNEARQGRILREGIKVVLAGHPNAGKSSLMNALTGHENAIVTPIAGTTRDVLREQIQIDGIALHIIDTAGLRQATDEIEKIGVERAWQQIEQADHLLLVVDSSSTTECCPHKLWPDNTQPLPQQPTITVIRNKVDLTDEPVGIATEPGCTVLRLCARSGDGIPLLRDHLKQTLGVQNDTEGLFLARRRHLKALEESTQHLQQGREQLLNFSASELLAESLRLAQYSLSTITGQFTSDDLLGEIFSRFCIGK